METPDFFIVSRKELILYLFTSPTVSWPIWLIGGIGLFAAIVGVFVDVRVMFVGLMLLLAVMPMVAFFIYFSCILDNHIMINILPHTIESRPGGYLVRIYREDRNEGADGREELEWVETGRMTIFESKVVKRVEKFNASVLYLVDSPVKVLYLPKDLHSEPVSCEINRKIQFS